MKIFLHSYTFRDHPLEDAFLNADRFDYDGVEITRLHFDEARLEEELPSAQTLADEYLVPIACVDYAGDFINDDPEVVKRSVELLERNIAVCAHNGVRLMNGYVGVLMGDTPEAFAANGSALATTAHYDRAAEALRHLGSFAGRLGVTLTVEIHMNTIHDTVESTVRLLDMVASTHVLATPDPGNMLATRSQLPDPEDLAPLAGRIGYFHLKNGIRREGGVDFSAGLEEGDVDINRYLYKLKDLGYNGSVCVEHVGDGDPRKLSERDIAYVRQCLAQLD